MRNYVPDVLQAILARKSEEIAERSLSTPLSLLRERAIAASPVRGFESQLQARVAANEAAVIAEVKKASPSKGVIREHFEPAKIAAQYEAGGATCLSVLTDRDFFQGSEDYLQQARDACELPVLRKDFTIDEYQITEARSIGADAILLIVAALDKPQLHDLCAIANGHELSVLVEVHDAQELELALDLPTSLLGINNRNLRDFTTSLDTTLDLLAQIPSDKLVVTESAIHTSDDVQTMLEAGVMAFLVGEAFMRAPDPGTELRSLFFGAP